jgi:hypothetical protein
MIWIILGVVGGIALGVYLAHDLECSWVSGSIFAITMGILGLIAGFIGTAFTTAIAETEADKTWVTKEETAIYSLKDNLGSEGNFLLGTGNVEGELYYYYVAESEMGYKVEKVKAGEAYIKYTDENPHIEEQTSVYENWFIRNSTCPSIRYIIHCPVNTIQKQYIVDLE